MVTKKVLNHKIRSIMEMAFSTVQYSIPFCFPDPKELRANLRTRLNASLVESDVFKKRYKGASLAFCFVLNDQTKELKVYGPSKGKGYIEYTIWLPYRLIKRSEHYLVEYLNQIQIGMFEVLTKYKFDLTAAALVFENMKQEVGKCDIE